MAETQLGKEIIEVIETLEKAAKAIMTLRDTVVQTKIAMDSLEKKQGEQEPGSNT